MKLSASLLFVLAVALSGCNPNDKPDDSASFKQVESLVAKNELDPAIAMLEAMRAKNANDPKVSARLAELYTDKREISKAVILYKEMIEKHPEIGLVQVPLGKIYIGLRQYPPAKECFEKARAQGVGDEYVALSLGICQAQLGDFEAADKEFERALKAGESEKTVRYNQALLRTEQKQMKQAKELLEGILVKDPNYAAAKRELAHVLQVMAPPDAATLKRSMDLLWEVKDELKDDPRMFEFMGDGWLLAGDFEACLASYTEALRLGQNPKSVQDKYVLAKQRQMDAEKGKPATDEKPANPPSKPK